MTTPAPPPPHTGKLGRPRPMKSFMMDARILDFIRTANPPPTIADVADHFGGKESIIYLSMRRLAQAGLIYRQQLGRTVHVWLPTDTDE